MNDGTNGQGGILIYKTKAGGVQIKIDTHTNTIWLTQIQIAQLFGTKRPAITKHLNNIFKTKELNKKSVCSKMELTAADGKKYHTQLYNLDAVLSIGYRVNSQQATQLRIWATNTLNQYLMKGYALNEKRLVEIKGRFTDLQKAITFLQEKSRKALLGNQAQELLYLLAQYSRTLNLLESYDKNSLQQPKGKQSSFSLQYDACKKVIAQVKSELMKNGEASELFGNEKDQALPGIIDNIYQTFDQTELYPSVEAKAAHLLYFMIKDHPFTDGNKRIASFLFIYFLDQTQTLYKDGEQRINDTALTALALLVAESDPKEKELLINLIMNLISA